MSDDILLLIIGAAVGFVSTVAVELTRRQLDKRRRQDEREYDEKHSREINLRKFIEMDEDMQGTPLAWLKLFETTSVPKYMRQAETTDTFTPITRLLSKSKSSRNNNGKYRAIEKVILRKTQLIGRQEDCEISLDDISVSRLHAMLRYNGDEYVLYDLGSTTGTFVNGEQVSQSGKALSNGDTIMLGKSSFRFEGTILGTKSRRAGSSRSRQAAITTLKDVRKTNQEAT